MKQNKWKYGISLFLPEIKELLAKKNYEELKKFQKEIYPIDLAEDWEKFSSSEKFILFHLLPHGRMIDLFEELEFDQQKELIDNLESQELKEVLDEMASDERADLFRELSEKTKKKLFAVMKKEKVEDVKKLLTYEENTAGSVMTTEFLELKKDMTARISLLKLQDFCGRHKTEDVSNVYITDERHHLIGSVSLQKLVTAPSTNMLLENIMSAVQTVKINVNQDQEEVAHLFSKYDLLSAPVVGDENQLLGVISIDDVVDVMEEETSEDIYGMGKISSVHDAVQINYGRASVFVLAKNRLIWLFILLLIEVFISGRLIKNYSHMLETLIVLTCFIPMLMDTGGNAGSQSLTMVVRGLATGEIGLNQIWKIICKEIFAGLSVGLLIGIAGMIVVFLVYGFSFRLGILVGLSLLLVITISTVTGALLPLLCKRIGLDPAVSASPFITTVVDATTIVVYFEIARYLFF
ncbi:magnesium transporter [bacterium]|nr:magnesium transporter [bacterium]